MDKTRTLALGDIHGCCTALDTLAGWVGFNEADTIVGLGDFVDRGPDTRDVIELLLKWEAVGCLVALRGNHEIMMMDSRDDVSMRTAWLSYGGAAVLESYGTRLMGAIPQDHWDFIERTRRYYETDTHIFAHATLDPELLLADQTDVSLFWDRFEDPQPHVSGKTWICGHTSQKSGLPLNYGHAICIDTWVYGEGWLTCLDVDSGTFWQANEKGEKRIDHISNHLCDPEEG